MRPLELRLRNFRSFFGGGHIFDFRERRLVGVVGPIGSGKSTILDAIAFALYGRTPRIGHATKSLIHQRSDHAAVSLRFEIDGAVWEAVRQLRRAGAGEHALYRLPGDEPGNEPVETVLLERTVNSRIEELLGLDYQGFGRSVLLAQGEFAEFLSARPAERDEVLKGVFGHDRIDAVRELAKEKTTAGRHAIEKLEIHLEHAEAARVRLGERQKDLSEADLRLEKLQAARPIFDERVEEVKTAEEAMKRAEARLGEFRDRAAELPDRLEGNRQAALTEHALAKRVEAARELEDASARLAEAEAIVASAEFRQREQRLSEAAELIVQLKARQDADEARLGELRSRTRDLPDQAGGAKQVGQTEHARAKRVEAVRELEDASARLAEAEAIVASAEFRQREQDLDKAVELIVQLKARQDAADQASEEVGLARDRVANGERSVDSYRWAVDRAHSEHEAARATAHKTDSDLRRAEKRSQDARHTDMAGSLRGRLTSGDKCPVCEQPVHRVPAMVGGDTASAEEAVERARSEREDSERWLRKAAGTVQASRAELEAARRQVSDSRNRVAEALVKEEKQCVLLDICCDELERLLGEGDPLARLGERRAALDSLAAAVAEARAVREVKRTVLDQATRHERRAQEGLSAMRTGILVLAEVIDSDLRVPAGNPEAIRSALTTLHDQWTRTTDQLNLTIADRQIEIDAASERLAEDKSYLDGLRAGVEEARWVRENARANLDRAIDLDQRMQGALSNLRARIAALATLLQIDFEIPEGDPGAVRSVLATLHDQWTRTTDQLNLTIADRQIEIDAASDRLTSLRAEHDVEDSIKVTLAEVKAVRRQVEADIEREAKLVDRVTGLADERRVWKESVRLNRRLVSDLTNSRFIRFLLDEERADLADLGSEHFERLSSGRYRFTEDGEFQVVDLNAADAVRRADSLSGGETFLASLGLALGLAEMVGRRGGRLDAFFLDEGFGTLDPEHLDLAMEGIESLVADHQRRLVVVVSHVPEVRRRIDDLIVLDKDGSTGDSVVVGGGGA